VRTLTPSLEDAFIYLVRAGENNYKLNYEPPEYSSRS
jgi:hypothetical protein